MICSLNKKGLVRKSQCHCILSVSWKRSNEKGKNCLAGHLDRVLFGAELAFPQILVLRLPQNTSNVNIECAGKLISYEYDQSNCILYASSFWER